eukprot:6149245-Amphidinium_carterae.1
MQSGVSQARIMDKLRSVSARWAECIVQYSSRPTSDSTEASPCASEPQARINTATNIPLVYAGVCVCVVNARMGVTPRDRFVR